MTLLNRLPVFPLYYSGKTKFIPIDSEHFSIMELTKNIQDKEIEEITKFNN